MERFYPPHFSEDAAWLPPWLLHPSTNPPSAQCHIHDVGRLQQSIGTRENGNLLDNCKRKSFPLFLSGEDNSPMTSPSCSTNHEVQYRLHLSSNGESQYSLNTILSNSQSDSERSAFRQAPLLQHPETKAIPEKEATEVNHNVDEAFIAPNQQRVNLEILIHKSPKSKEQKGINSKVTAKSRKAGMNDAVELAVAASEALTIHEVVKDEPSMKLSFASAVLEAAMRVKRARLEDFEETYSSSIEESYEIDFDFLSDLDELSMADAYEDVGLTITGYGDLSGYGSMSHVRDTYASQSYVSSSKQKCTEPGGLEVGSGSASPEQHRSVTGRTNTRPESMGLGRENADLACDIDAVFGCSIEQANFNTTEVVLEREGFTIEDPQLSKTILRSCVQSGTSGYNGREDKMTNLVQDRFQSRWFGGWTSKSEGNIPADADDKCRKSIPELFANETSSFSESADIAPDMNSCIQRQDKECKTVSQSSVAPEHTNERCSNNENFHSDDVAATPSESPMDLFCSVVPCSFASDNVVSQNSNHQADLENIDGPIVEPNFDNLERVPPQNADLLTGERRFISRVNVGHPSTISRRAASLKTFSMLPRCDPYLDKEQTHGESLPSEHNQTTNVDTELAVQMEKEMNVPTTINSENITSCLSPIVSGEENIEQNVVSESNVELLEPTTRLFRKVECNLKNYLVPRRKRVRFSECEINYPQVKKFKKAPQVKLKDPLVARRICRRLRNSKPRAKSNPHEVEKHCLTDKNKLFQDLKFLLTGFSVKKHKEITNLIQNNGGVVLDDFSPPSTSRGKKSVKCKSQLLPLILCPRRLLTTKFLYGCAVNACILKVNWLFDSVEEGLILPPKEYMVLKNVSESYMVIGKPVSRTYFIFDNIAIMLHGKPDFCSKMAKVIKHGGGLVFKTFHWLVKSVDSKKVLVGAIVLEDENGVSRQLKQCALEQKIPIMPLSWIINSLYAGKLLSSPELKLPDLPTNVELSEEI
nr:hypothetical protein [Tanacetum cinerariifolium]GEX36503.1 hypothetical protein [Tanacetum cinerariifolium]